MSEKLLEVKDLAVSYHGYAGEVQSVRRVTFDVLNSIVAVPVCIPTNNVREFPFLHTLSSIYCL